MFEFVQPAVATVSRFGRAFVFTAVLAASVGTLTTTALAQTPPSEVTVVAGKSSTIETTEDLKDIMVADPTVADVLPLTNRSVYVVGKKMGATAVSIYGANKRLLMTTTIVVSADVDTLRSRIKDLMPGETDIAVRAANQSIVLSGVASSANALHKAMTLAESYAPGKIVNLMGVEGTQQVMLSVRIVEMERTVAKDLRVNVERSQSPHFNILTGDTTFSNNNVLERTFGQLLARIATGSGDINILFDAMEEKGLIKTLAQPTLVAMSGDTASFLAGGEFPIPVQQQGGTGGAPIITIEYKQFGVALAFTPTVLEDGLINLAVSPEVSSIDPTSSVDLGAIKVPGIKVRRVNTTVELRDGESFTIAGLLRDDYQSQMQQYPFLGDIPILGALFKSNGYKRNETELVVIVTPHLATPRRGRMATPADSFTPPSDVELFLFGRREQHAPLKPEDRVLLSADPTKGGIDGPHGHILQ